MGLEGRFEFRSFRLEQACMAKRQTVGEERQSAAGGSFTFNFCMEIYPQ